MKINIKDIEKWVNTDEKFEKFKPKLNELDSKNTKKKVKNYK